MELYLLCKNTTRRHQNLEGGGGADFLPIERDNVRIKTVWGKYLPYFCPNFDLASVIF